MMKVMRPISDIDEMEKISDLEVVSVDDNLSEALIFDNVVHNLENKPKVAWIQDSSLFLKAVRDSKWLRNVKLFILDLNMPEVDGFECKKALEKKGHFKKTPTILMSNSSEEQDVQKAYELNFNSYLVKDSNINDFKEKIQHTFTYWLNCNHYN